jgi:transcription initiation factor TFIIB
MQHGMHICSGCGLQLGPQIITEDTEWRTFEDDGHNANKVDPNRVGAPETGDIFEAVGITTLIEGTSALAKQQNSTVFRGIEKSLTFASKRIDEICSKMALVTSVATKAKEIFKSIETGKIKMKKIKNKDSLIVACIYRGCRDAKIPRTFNEFSKATDAKLRLIKRAYKRIKSAMNDEISKSSGDIYSSSAKRRYMIGTEATSPMQLLTPSVKKLGLGMNIEHAASLYIKTSSGKMGSTTAPSIVAASIYRAIEDSVVNGNKNDWRSIEKIANICNISSGTIRSVSKKF